VWQSDGGSEFIGSWQAKEKSAFIKAVEAIGATHFQIPKVTYNADVETVHNTIEFEFFDIEAFNSRDMFFDKATTYGLYYNLMRKNSNRGDRSPLETLMASREDFNPAVLTLPALDLDKLLAMKLKSTPGGHDVPGMSLVDKKYAVVLGYNSIYNPLLLLCSNSKLFKITSFEIFQ